MIRCRLFGHKIPRTWYGSHLPYFKRGRSRPVDGIGRIHQSLKTNCARCGREFEFGIIHDYPRPEGWPRY